MPAPLSVVGTTTEVRRPRALELDLVIDAPRVEVTTSYRAEKGLSNLLVAAAVNERRVFIAHRDPEWAIGSFVAGVFPDLRNRVVDAPRVETQPRGSLVAYCQPVARPEVPCRAPGCGSERVMVSVKDVAHGECAL